MFEDNLVDVRRCGYVRFGGFFVRFRFVCWGTMVVFPIMFTVSVVGISPSYLKWGKRGNFFYISWALPKKKKKWALRKYIPQFDGFIWKHHFGHTATLTTASAHIVEMRFFCHPDSERIWNRLKWQFSLSELCHNCFHVKLERKTKFQIFTLFYK